MKHILITGKNSYMVILLKNGLLNVQIIIKYLKYRFVMINGVMKIGLNMML